MISPLNKFTSKRNRLRQSYLQSTKNFYNEENFDKSDLINIEW